MVSLNPAGYALCQEYARKRGSNTKNGTTWNDGILNLRDPKHPRATEFCGLAGEFAFSKITGIPLDLNYYAGGDEQDFIIFDQTHTNAKCASTIFSFRKAQLKATNEWGNLLPLEQDLYVFGGIFEDRGETATVWFTGAATKKMVLRYPMVPSRLGTRWDNYEIPFEELIPMKQFLEVYQAGEAAFREMLAGYDSKECGTEGPKP